MYKEYWKLNEMPFENNFDLRYLYLSSQHEEAVTRMIYVVKNRRHGGVLSGGYGMGKTLLISYLVQQLELSEWGFQVVNIKDPFLSMQEFYREFFKQVDGRFIEKSQEDRMITNMEKTLVNIHNEEGHMVVVIDDATFIPIETLKELHLLLDLCHPKTQQPLLSMLLSGHYGGVDAPSEIPVPALRQRLPLRCDLEMFSEDQCAEYIQHRLEVAGSANSLFTEDAVKMIADKSKGAPRSINNICDLGLFIGYSQDAVKVDVDIIETVTAEIAHSLE